MHSYKPNIYNIYKFNLKVAGKSKPLLATLLILIAIMLGVSCVQRQIISSIKQKPNANAININTANEAELNKLPGIGEELARRIIEYREKNGNFRKPEHLLLVRGISEAKFRRINSMITAN